MCTTCAVTHFNQIPWGCVYVSPRDWCLNLMTEWKGIIGAIGKPVHLEPHHIHDAATSKSFQASLGSSCFIWVQNCMHFLRFRLSKSNATSTQCISESSSTKPQSKTSFSGPCQTKPVFSVWILTVAVWTFEVLTVTLYALQNLDCFSQARRQRTAELPTSAKECPKMSFDLYYWLYSQLYITLSNTNRLCCDVYIYIFYI